MASSFYRPAQYAVEFVDPGSADRLLVRNARTVLEQADEAIDWACGKLAECGCWMLDGAYFEIRGVLFDAELLYRLHGADTQVRNHYIDFGIRDFTPMDRLPGYTN